MHKFEGLLLRRGARGGVKPLMWRYAKNGVLSALWPWVPGARRVIWCPKRRFVEALATIGLPWHTSGRGAFAGHLNFANPPLLMDSVVAKSSATSIER